MSRRSEPAHVPAWQHQLTLCAALDPRGGARYTLDRKDANFVQSVNVPLGFQSSITQFNGVRRSDKQVSGDVTLTWKPADDLLTYGTVRKGLKTEALHRRLRLNGDIFKSLVVYTTPTDGSGFCQVTQIDTQSAG